MNNCRQTQPESEMFEMLKMRKIWWFGGFKVEGMREKLIVVRIKRDNRKMINQMFAICF